MHNMYNMRHHLSAFWSRLTGSTLCELSDLFADKVPQPELEYLDVKPIVYPRDRIFTQWRTFWIFTGQVLSADQTCREALRKAQVWIYLDNIKNEEKKNKKKKKKNEMISSGTSAYSKARGRLNPDYLDKVNEKVIEKSQSQIKPEHLWCGRDVKIVDGSSVSMPDTEENQELYPQPSGQKKGCGFPVMRIVVMFSLATGLMLACRKGSLKESERILWHQMWDVYQKGDVVLADRGFCSYADYWLLSEREVDCVMRLHQKRKNNKLIKKFNKNDRLVEWERGGASSRPKWLTKEQWNEIPQSMMVRLVDINVDIPGFRTKNIIVATTLLDNKKYPPQAIAHLYLQRWLGELFIRDIKTTMRMNVLRCKTPEMVYKELTIFMIVYNFIRSLIWQAALNNGIKPYRISFAGTIATIRQWAPILAAIDGYKKKARLLDALMDLLATDVIPIRKEPRREPRAIKRRTNSNYQLLTKPRQEFIEIPHRHKYRKI